MGAIAAAIYAVNAPAGKPQEPWLAIPRAAVEQAVESAIAWLDRIDGDSDREPDDPDEDNGDSEREDGL